MQLHAFIMVSCMLFFYGNLWLYLIYKEADLTIYSVKDAIIEKSLIL